MGQKISPEIFRLESLNNNWKSKYTENKASELSGLFFKSLEIKKFVKQLMKFHGASLHNCKIALSSTSLHLILSYYVTKRAGVIIKRKLRKNHKKKISIDLIKDIKKKKKRIELTKILMRNLINIYYYKCFRTTKIKNKIKHKNKKRHIKKFGFNKFLNTFKKKIGFKYLYSRKKVKKKLKMHVNYFKNHYRFRRQFYYVMQIIKKKLKTKKLRFRYIKKIKEHSGIIEYENINNVKKNNFKKKFIENLSKFVGEKYSLFVTIKNIKINNIKEAYSKKDAKFIKRKLYFKLFKYRKSKFLKIAKRVIFITTKKINSAQFLADFISSRLNRLKKEEYFFLKCIKDILTFLLKKTRSFTRISGIKIITKGRLKKARRAKRRTFKIIIGRVPLQSIRYNINHAKATSYTPNGTFGTEVWINYFRNKKYFYLGKN